MGENIRSNRQQKIVVLTGGTSGIGLACVKKFVAAKNIVVTCARSPFDFSAVLGGACQNVRFLQLDLAQPNAIGKLIDLAVHEFGRLDVLINNAAFVPKKDVTDFTDEDLQSAFDVNLKSLVQSTQAAFRIYRSQESGTIINLSSMAAVDPFPGFSIYGGCKAFVETFTHAIANEGRDHNIFCVSIRAGTVETPLLRRVIPDFPADETLAPEEVANLIFDVVNNRDFSISGNAIPIEFVSK